MKKLLSLLLTLALLLSLAGCATSQTPNTPLTESTSESTHLSTQGTTQTAEPTETLPPQVDQTDPPQTLPPQVDQTDPPETLPPQVDQTDPPETLPPQVDQTDPPETLPPQIDQTDPPEDTPSYSLDPNGSYTTKEDVALYIHLYGHLPSNFMTKSQARQYGWKSGSLEKYASGYCIGGDVFKNREGLLPSAPGRTYRECDIDTLGRTGSRGSKRIVYSNDGLIYYTSDHYESFTLLYGAP